MSGSWYFTWSRHVTDKKVSSKIKISGSESFARWLVRSLRSLGRESANLRKGCESAKRPRICEKAPNPQKGPESPKRPWTPEKGPESPKKAPNPQKRPQIPKKGPKSPKKAPNPRKGPESPKRARNLEKGLKSVKKTLFKLPVCSPFALFPLCSPKFHSHSHKRAS